MLEIIKRANNASETVELINVKKEEDLSWGALIGFFMNKDNFCFNIKTMDNIIGSIILSFRDECSEGVFIEYIYIHDKYKRNGFGKMVVDYLKEIFDNVFGESEEKALYFWEAIGAEILNDNNLFIY